MNGRYISIRGLAIATVLLGFAQAAVAQPGPTAADVLRIRWVNPPNDPPEGVRHALSSGRETS